MNMKIQLLQMVVATLVAFSQANNNNNPFCNVLTCPNKSHTLCKYNDSCPADACGRILRSGLTQNERDDILEIHNEVRITVHNGKEGRGLGGSQPAAVSYVPLEWDNDLEFSAQRWANQCTNSKDVCRDMHYYLVGQNVELMEGDKYLDNIVSPIEIWYKQVDNFSARGIKSYSPLVGAWSDTDEYTQMVWGKTKKIGCGSIKFSVKNKLNSLIVCNYAPAGNIENEPVYRTPKLLI